MLYLSKQHSIVKLLARKFVHIHTEAYSHHFEVKRENIEDSTIHTEEKATLTQKEKRNVQKYKKTLAERDTHSLCCMNKTIGKNLTALPDFRILCTEE